MKKIGVLAVIAFFIVGCGSSGGGKTSQTVEEICHDKDIAYIKLKEYTKSRLKSPSTAEFREEPLHHSNSDDDCEHFFISNVDAQNSFGATLRKSFRGKVIYDMVDKVWRLDYIQFQ